MGRNGRRRPWDFIQHMYHRKSQIHVTRRDSCIGYKFIRYMGPERIYTRNVGRDVYLQDNSTASSKESRLMSPLIGSAVSIFNRLTPL